MAADDLDLLGLRPDGDGRSSFELTAPLSRLDGKLYGGTGLAVAVAAMEAETGRSALWATVQFVGSAVVGERIDVHTEVLAAGRKVSQCRVTATVGDRLVLLAVGATAVPRSNGLTAQFGEVPAVPAPEASADFASRLPIPMTDGPTGFLLAAELRVATGGPADPMALWARMRDRPLTRAGLAFLADVVPSGVARAAGRAGGGLSLDNSIRFGPDAEGDWVLVEVEPHLAVAGYGHGLARLWSPDGTLLAVASQTASMLLFD